jgi:hypothetical protein
MTEPRSEPFVSIITPVYNGEKFLAECIESVLAQTYQNWEYLIVNNQSKDRSLEIARHYERRDPRIRVLTTECFYRKGTDSWNNAVRQMSPAAKYCKILHADDWLFPQCLEKMVQVAEAHPSIGVVSSYRLCNRRLDCDGLPYPSTFVSGKEIARQYLLGHLSVFGSPSTTLLRSDLVRARPELYILFTGTDSNEYLTDMEVCLYALQQSDFGFVHEVLSFTRIHPTSVTSDLLRTGQKHTIPEFLHILKRYGPVFLTPEEQQARATSLLREYHRFIAVDMLMGRGDLAANQLKQLELLGLPISRSKLWRIAAVMGIKALLRPIAGGLRLLKARFTSNTAPVASKATHARPAESAAKAAGNPSLAD